MNRHPERSLVLLALGIALMVGLLAGVGRALPDKVWIRDREVALAAPRFAPCALAALSQVDGVRALPDQDLTARVGFEATAPALAGVVGEIYRVRPGVLLIRLASHTRFVPPRERASDVLLDELADAVRRRCGPEHAGALSRRALGEGVHSTARDPGGFCRADS